MDINDAARARVSPPEFYPSFVDQIEFWKAIVCFRGTCAIIIEASSRLRNVLFSGGLSAAHCRSSDERRRLDFRGMSNLARRTHG